MIELARVKETIAAPMADVWAVVADFAHPQRLAESIARCEVSGEGVGAVRTVHARGLVIHERLVEADAPAGRFQYEILPSGDMPDERMTRYLATVVLRPLSPGSTEIEWCSAGAVNGDVAPVSAMLNALYARAIARIRDLTS